MSNDQFTIYFHFSWSVLEKQTDSRQNQLSYGTTSELSQYYIVAHTIQCYFAIQEEDRTHHSILDVIRNIVKKLYEACGGGVPIP